MVQLRSHGPSSRLSGTLRIGPLRKNDRALNHILQLADISRPGIADQRVHGFGRDGFDLLAHIKREMLREVADQERYVFGALAQRRHMNGKNVQVDRTRSERNFCSSTMVAKIAIGGSDKARVGAQRA